MDLDNIKYQVQYLTKDCPICKQKIDNEHFDFVTETVNDPEKLELWMAQKWTFEMWKKLQ